MSRQADDASPQKGQDYDGPHPSDMPAYRVLRTCARCGQPIAIDERTFYFLDAVDGSALCMDCVQKEERHPSPSPSFTRTPVDLFPRVASPEIPTASSRSGAVSFGSSPRVRTIEEYFLEIDLALLSIPPGEPLASIVRKLETEAQRQLDAGRMLDARRIVVTLNTKLEELGYIPKESDSASSASPPRTP